MVTYKKIDHSFEYDIIIDNNLIGKLKGVFIYGQNKTYYDSFIEIEFIPYPNIKTIANIKINDDYYITLKENLNPDTKTQINDLSIKLINQVVGNYSEFEIEKDLKRYVYMIMFENENLNIEVRLIHESNIEKYKQIQILPNNDILKFPDNKPDDDIVSMIYDMINNKNPKEN